MVERIRAILDRYQLTPTQFADAIGTARPIVSHILGGRNKPSLEVVQKIVAAFPDLSLPWLLSGTGPMEAVAPIQAQDTSSSVRAKPLAKPTTPRTLTQAPVAMPEAVQAPKEAVEQIKQNNMVQEETVSAEPPVRPAPIAEPVAITAPLPATAAIVPPVPVFQALAEPGKAIRRIVIFYSDGTFSDFQPETTAN